MHYNILYIIQVEIRIRDISQYDISIESTAVCSYNNTYFIVIYSWLLILKVVIGEKTN